MQVDLSEYVNCMKDQIMNVFSFTVQDYENLMKCCDPSQKEMIFNALVHVKA